MAIDTKDRILDAAERLFGERGFPATSLRDITAGAGVNVASVNYHFGSKEALLTAVLARRLGPINRERLALLDAVDARAAGAPPPVEEVVRAFVLPPFERHREWSADAQHSSFLRLVGRIHGETNGTFRAMFFEQFEEVFQRFESALRRALPDQPDVSLRMLFMIGSMAFTMSWRPTLVPREADAGRDPRDVVEALVRYTAAGMAARPEVAAPVAVAAGARSGRQ